jgi:nucleotidyltransferase substrate binding protein (TIGR01987 family)
MEKLTLKYGTITKALNTLNKSLTKLKNKKFDDYEELRDSIIQRFEYSTDTFWKYLNEYLKSKFKVKIPAPRPKLVLQECLDVDLISKDEFEICIAIISDRNETSHGYNEKLAEEICQEIPKYYETMNKIIQRIKP